MNRLTHLLNIGTLATWLSFAAFGAVGTLTPDWKPVAAAVREPLTSVMQEDFTLSVEGNPQDTPPAPVEATAESLPAPPDLPDLADLEPLPEIPDLPAPALAPQTSQTSAPGPNNPPKSSASHSGKNSSTAKATQGKPGGSGLSNAARIAAGHMPSPSYPAAAKRNNQTGTTVIEFTVDASGHVISAYAKSSSGWPLLDSEAVLTVRRWTFPVGGVMKLQRPIVFQLR